MTFRTLTTTAVMAGATALAQAPHSATLILRNGDRVTGLVRQASEPPAPVSASPAARTFHVRMADGQQLSVAAEDVAVIDFVGGRPSTAELDALGADTPHLMTLRNGNSRSGRLVGILGGDVVRWESQAGARVEVPIRNVTRIYLDQETALELFDFESPAARQPGLVEWIGGVFSLRREVIVDPSIAWVETGSRVVRGDRLRFKVTGAIRLSRTPGDTTGPAGRTTLRSARAPLPDVPIGTLIARVEDGAPFAIGDRRDAIEMASSGRLFLGINDDTLSNNSGSYRVTVEIEK